ncbi:MAG: hypothetical protein PVJ39_05370 [Gammaproteobacteria bacterium]|jgi:hypothetical protein
MSSNAARDSTRTPDNRSLTVVTEHSDSLLDTVVFLREKFKSTGKNKDDDKNLPVAFDFNNSISASRLLEKKYPIAFVPENYGRSRREVRYMLAGFAAFLLLVYIGWAALSGINYLEDGNFVYNTGLIGGILMLVAILYSAYKRVTLLRHFITMDVWYYTHITCGAIGALLIIVHSSFNLKSINSSVAFVAMLFVIFSGALGRYLYTQFSLILHKQYSQIKEQEPELFEMITKYECETAQSIRKRLSKFALYCLKQPTDIAHYLQRFASVLWYGAYLYFNCARDLEKIITSISVLADLNTLEVNKLKRSQMRQLRQYVVSVVQMGYVSLLEQLFGHWRVLHVPMLYLLVITAVSHVVVVHMY